MINEILYSGGAMKKSLIAVVVVVLVLGGLWVYQVIQHDGGAEDNRPVVKIGASLPLSGNMADVGMSGQQALKMAYDRWQGIDTKYKYDLIIEDDALDAKRVASVANKFVNIDHVNAILTMFSTGANVVSPVADKAKILHVTCSYGSQPAEGFYNFNNHTQYEENARVLISELKKKGVKSISLFSQNNIGSVQQGEVLTDMMNKDGSIKILANENFNLDVRDFTMIIRKALQKGEPDIFYFSGLSPSTMIFAKNLEEITGTLKLVSINDFSKYNDKTPFNGLWFVESAYGTDDFVKEFKKINKAEPLNCGSNMYDNLDMLIWAFENTTPKAGDAVPSSDDVVNTLHSIKNWQGAIGNIYVDEAGIIQSKASVKEIKDGTSVTIK